MTQFDSYIFDMDGTLWDAVDSYCAIWNATIAQMGIDAPEVTRPKLESMMGTPIDGIFDTIIGDAADRKSFLERLERNSTKMMPQLGGKLYPGVKETLEELSRRARLFMVSNCDRDTLPAFLDYTGLREYMTDWLSFGQTGVEKDVNIRALADRYNLKAPVYIGDTAGDMRATHAAGIPFIWAAYGFGKDVTGQEYTINSISELLTLHDNAGN